MNMPHLALRNPDVLFTVIMLDTGVFVEIGFSRRLSGKESGPANADTRDVSSVPGSGRSPGVGNGNPLQYSCLESSMDSGASWAIIQRIAESDMTERAHTPLQCILHTRKK